MLVTRATRHDRADIEALYDSEGWEAEGDLGAGSAYIARDGHIVGCVRLIEIGPQLLVVDDVVVRSERRGEGIGARLMQTAMNSRAGTLYLCCHVERIAFYERLGFAASPFEDLPGPVQDYMRACGDYPTEPDHVHYFMTAR